MAKARAAARDRRVSLASYFRLALACRLIEDKVCSTVPEAYL